MPHPLFLVRVHFRRYDLPAMILSSLSEAIAERPTTFNAKKALRIISRSRPAGTQVHDPYPFPPGGSPVLTSVDIPPESVKPSRQSTFSFDLTDSSRYFEYDHFCTKQGMKHHPYGQDATYMQGYDPILLENDRYTDILLQKLNPTGTPTFRVPSRPPTHVLDLGCGPGHWALDAAAAWRSAGTKVVGLDLCNVFPEEWNTNKGSMPNVQFVRGNFLKYKLPFPDNMFDLVRMANLSLCIPYNKWEFVLGEVRRVMAPSGRLELIDDEIFYPYGKLHSQPSSTSSDTKRHASLFGEPSTETDGHEGYPDDGEDMDLSSRPRLVYPDPGSNQDTLITRSKNLEAIFEKMLKKKYRIYPKPYHFIRRLLCHFFGKRNVTKVASKHLLLVPPNSSSSDGDKSSDRSRSSTDSGFSSAFSSTANLQTTKSWNPLSREKDDKSNPSDASPWEEVCPEANKRKVADILGLERRSTLYQPSGLILWPSTFIPMSPSEVEMHVCKHMHVLLGCKVALGEYISDFRDERGRALVDKNSFEDLIWDYESFRRYRFNWPADTPEMWTEEATLSRKASFTSKLLINGHSRDNSSSSIIPKLSKRPSGPTEELRYKYEELTHVRTIRIFEAFKMMD